ncbi:acyl-CoA dehydrogenase family protein [Actinomycetospora lutea]|uniref:acyl-CoA dehydrogenase family protein n=1 Tax=Actinomycetospora lutea TaxID=663604 RepID=UPI0023663D6E|nr:acyl-CoA dehydrogenase family protein [Actinomycetospora lutea]MDD7938033.1 acyl-CoA dehydrogenase family protein [Actinomycetospora lutea]
MVAFTEEHQAFRKTVRTFVEREIDPYVDQWERDERMPTHELFAKLGELGVLGLEYDPAYGGGGADHLFSVVLAEEIGRADAAGVGLAIAVQTDMATPSLARFGSHELKERYLAPAIRGEHVTAIAVTEPDAGSDVAGLRTRAVRDGDEWVIHGSKLYITNGVQADWLCLLARTSDEGPTNTARGMSQIVVPTDTPGVSVSRTLDKLGNRCSDTAELSFDGARVPVGNTIGREGRGFQQQMAQFQNERMVACYGRVGACERALDRTAAYLRKRHAFGGPLITNQYLSYQLAELYARVDMCRHYNYACAEAYMRGEDTSRFATIAKLAIGRLCEDVARTCLQYHGGLGYIEETWTARFLRDMRITSIGGGADEVMLRVIAKMHGM